MIVTVTKKALAGAISLAERIIPSRSAAPGLTLVRLDVRGDRLTLSGASHDADVETTVTGVEGGGEGSFAMPAHVFAQVVRAAPAQSVELRFGKQLTVHSGSFKTNIQLVDPSQMPQIEFPEEYSTRVDAAAFARAISSVRYAAAMAEFQAIFRGLALEQRNGKARLVATDGFRLAYTDLEADLGLEKPVVVMAKIADELTRFLGGGEVEIAFPQQRRLSVRGESFRMNLSLMEGNFPDYERVIPAQFPLQVKVRAKEFVAAVNRVSLMAEKTANNRVDMLVKGGQVTLTAEGSMGRSQEILDVEQSGPESEMLLAFNARFLTEALGPLEEAEVKFSGSANPAVFTPVGGGDYLAMVVPLRTQ